MTRIILILTLMLATAIGVSAQETTTPATDTAAVAPAPTATDAEAAAAPDGAVVAAGEEGEGAPGTAPGRNRERVRNEFTTLLRQHPPEVSRILAIDPTLVLNGPFLARYPEVERFVAANPEIRRNPHYYLGTVRAHHAEERRESAAGTFDDFLEGLVIFATFALIAFALGWLIRTVVEQKRWNRLSRTQTEVHNKILDRFGTSEELLAYVKTPAGTKFLESAPIPLHAEKATQQHPTNPSLARIMWSIQLGVVVAVGAIGMLLVSLVFERETAQGFFAIGMIAFSVGAGFIASAVVSIVLSRRLGFLGEQEQDRSAAASAFDDSGRVR